MFIEYCNPYRKADLEHFHLPLGLPDDMAASGQCVREQWWNLQDVFET